MRAFLFLALFFVGASSLTAQDTNLWKTLSKITYEKKFDELLGFKVDVPVFADALVRTDFKGSQTKLNNLERVENVAASFGAGMGDFSGKHLLLVDDVLTTGATLDFCGQVLLREHPGVRISVATLAVAHGN